ncbi:MAG: TIGR04086 family membrane protein [Clostridia bacterium]|nr:TIGR04086 family membrane protein [Clostridia bacterium]
MNRTVYKKSKPRRARTQADGGVALPSPRHILKSLAVTCGAGLLLILSLSLALYFSPNPSPLVQPVGLIAAALTALIGGFAAARIHGQSALLCGLINGIGLLAIMLLLSLFFAKHTSAYSALVSCLLHACVPVLSVAGAYLGLRRTPKKKKRKR